MNLGIISLGCAKNLVDSELFLGVAIKYQFKIVTSLKEADVIVVNTCGFIESAKKEAIDTILEVLSYHKITIVIGCLVQRYYQELKQEIPEVDYYIPISQYHQIDKIFQKITGSKTSYHFNYNQRLLATKPNFAYLRIAEGCNNRCHYCAIPLIRGSFVSRDPLSLIEEVKSIAKQDISELVIIAQDTTNYGSDLDGDITLATLLDQIASLKLFKWIRVLYLYPDEITDQLLDVFEKHQSLIKYFDIPIQHASTPLLKAMNRRGTQEDIITIYQKIRSRFNDAILRTTLIVGYPTETDQQFNQLKQFIQDYHFEHLGAFGYSEEEDTVAYDLEPKISPDVIKDRLDQIMMIQQQLVFEYNQSRIGKVYDVIVEKYDYQKRLYATRSYIEAPDDVDGYIYVKLDPNTDLTNLQVIITGVDGYNLYGEVYKKL